MTEQFENQVHQDLHQFLLSMKEVDERMPECPDVEDKWETIAQAYISDGIREFQDFPAFWGRRITSKYDFWKYQCQLLRKGRTQTCARHVSKRHPQMSMWNRAAQFASFAALTGYDEAIKESAQENEKLFEE